MSVHLNDLSKVYLQNVFESSHNSDDEPKMKKKHKKHDREDDNGEENNDDEPRWQNSDGDNKWYEPGEDVAAPKKKKKITTEGFSNWRNDLIEVIEPERLPSKMKEGNVDNYNGKNKCVTINPEVKEQVQILESFELSEEYITETVNSAVDYFMEEGINEDGLEIIINELGIEEFVSFVFEVGNQVLTEARRGGVRVEPVTKGGKPVGSLKGGAKTAAINRLRKEKAARKEAESKASASKPSGFKSFSQKHTAVKNAKKQQPSKKPVRDAIARGVFGAVKAINLAKETGKTIAKAAKVGAQGASEFGKGVKSGATATVDAVKKANKVINAGYEFQIDEKNQGPSTPVKSDPKMGIVPDLGAGRPGKVRLKKQYGVDEKFSMLDEKATSEQQQKLFGLALSVKRGQTPRSEVSAEVLKIVDSMSEKEIRKYAKTKHEGIPKKVAEESEGVPQRTKQQISADQQLITAKKKKIAADQQALRQEDFFSEEESDTMKDRHLESGGMGARSSTSPAKPSKSTKPYDPQKRQEVIKKAIELVRKQTTDEFGNKAFKS